MQMQLSDDSDAARSNRVFTFLLFAFLYIPFIYLFGYRFRTIDFMDFPSFYWGAHFAFVQHLSPYGRDVFLLQEVMTRDVVFPYLYPPPSLVLFAPFLLFGYRAANLVMLGINHIAVLGILYLLLYRVVDGVRVAPAVFIFFLMYLLWFQPVETTLDHGQINLVVLALVLFAWFGLREGRHAALIGASLGLAILFKTYPIMFLPLLLFRRRYDALGWTLGTVALVTVIAAAVVPAAAWRDWFLYVLPTGGYGATPLGLFSPANPHNQSINGFLQRLFVPNPFTDTWLAEPTLATIFGYVGVGIIGGATLWLSYRVRQLRSALDLEIPLYLLAMFLIAPLSWNHHEVFALPAVMVIMLRLLHYRHYAALALLALPCAMVLAFPMPFTFVSLKGTVALLALSLKLYAVAGLWLLAAVLLFIEGRQHEQRVDDVVDTATVVPLKRAARA